MCHSRHISRHFMVWNLLRSLNQDCPLGIQWALQIGEKADIYWGLGLYIKLPTLEIYFMTFSRGWSNELYCSCVSLYQEKFILTKVIGPLAKIFDCNLHVTTIISNKRTKNWQSCILPYTQFMAIKFHDLYLEPVEFEPWFNYDRFGYVLGLIER